MNGGFELIREVDGKGFSAHDLAHQFQLCVQSVRRSNWNKRFHDTPKCGSFFMSKLNDEYIEEAFAQIRAKFEERNNDTGLEILDSYEERWEAKRSLSESQLSWLERQLDGSWRPKRVRPSLEVIHGGPAQKRDNGWDEVAVSGKEAEPSLDAMIREKLSGQGEVVVDLRRLDELEAVIEELRQSVKAIRSS